MPATKPSATKPMIFVEIEGCSFTKGAKVHLFSPHLLKQDWSKEAVAAINKSLQTGRFERAGDIRLRATKVRSSTGWREMK